MIGRLYRVPLREVWRHEALDFTRWLQNNVDALNDVLGLSLASAEREQAAGTFSVDLVAEDAAGNAVVIENQLERSDHDHLGKLLTYLVAVGARTAIWIVADPRPEHVAVVTWLNESAAADFYLVKVEGVRIGDSPPAPLLTLIVGPSTEGRAAGATKKDLAERHVLRYEFWEGLLALARQHTPLHANVSPSHDNSRDASSGRPGTTYTYIVREHSADAVLYIRDESKRGFDQLFRAKEAVEAAFGGPLDWHRQDNQKASYINKKTVKTGGYRDQEGWPEVQRELVDAMVRLEQAFRPHLAR